MPVTQPQTPKEQKMRLRPVCAAVRARIPDKEQKANEICRLVQSLPAFRDAETVLCYLSAGSEVETRGILEACFRAGKRVALPRCYEDSRMEFLPVTAVSQASELSRFGIAEPPHGEPLDPADAGLCLVPALAFDKNGFRLGYGMGYYDRYLKRFSGTAVGLCYEDCLREALPVNQNDRPVHLIVTEQQVITIL